MMEVGSVSTSASSVLLPLSRTVQLVILTASHKSYLLTYFSPPNICKVEEVESKLLFSASEVSLQWNNSYGASAATGRPGRAGWGKELKPVHVCLLWRAVVVPVVKGNYFHAPKVRWQGIGPWAELDQALQSVKHHIYICKKYKRQTKN